ncbi:hypothetical protein PMAC_001290 [Pneumocystis sp. 'macacae']|nr:hypothetical protein PMAC_001290 [Pneumocystis sp. 'macacae']
MFCAIGMSATTLRRPICAIVGATGTGKSRLAIALAAALGGEVINGDALQVYHGADILTNKPSITEREGVPHHLLGTIDRSDTYSVQRFERDALEIIANLHSAGQLPILVGGTHYYTQAVLFKNTLLTDYQGIKRKFLSEFSALITKDERSSDKDVLQHSSYQDLSLLSTNELYTQLKALDPIVAQRWHPHDRRRIQRSLEICLSTGQRPSDLYRAQHKTAKMTNVDLVNISVLTDQTSTNVLTHASKISKDICLALTDLSPTFDNAFCDSFIDEFASDKVSGKVYTNLFSSDNLLKTSLSNSFSTDFVNSNSYGNNKQTHDEHHRFKACIFWIYREQKVLNQLLDKRVEEMCAAGMLNDIQMLYSEWDAKNKQNRTKDGSNNTNDGQKRNTEGCNSILDTQDTQNKTQSEIELYNTLGEHYNFKNIQNNLQNYIENNVHSNISNNLRGIWQAIGFKAFLPYLELPEDTLSTVKHTYFMRSIAAMQLATRQYARKQIKWIRNKLYPLCCSSGPDIRFYLLDATNPTDWETKIQNLAITLVKDFLHNCQGPDPLSLNATAMQLLAPKKILNYTLQTELWKHYVCSICKMSSGEPFVAIGLPQWLIHIHGRRHRTRLVRHGQKQRAGKILHTEESSD